MEKIRAKARFLRRVKEFQGRPLFDDGDHGLLLEAFLASRGKSLTKANKILSSGATHAGRTWSSGELLPIELQEGNEAVEQLNKRGYYRFSKLLNPSVVAYLSELLSSGQMNLVSDDPSVNGKKEKLNLQQPLAEKYGVPHSTYINDPVVQQLMLDSGILSIASRYLSSIPIVDNVSAWHSFPVGRASNEAATMFHFDLERVKWVKLFVFLTDVSRSTGTHLFVPGTHKDGGIPADILKNRYRRISDAQVTRHFGEDSFIAPEGPAGTFLMEDTRGLHKGLPLVEGHRLVLQFQYTSSLFGAESDLASLEVSPSNIFRSTLQRTPEILSGFRSMNVD